MSIAASYGVNESNGIVDPQGWIDFLQSVEVDTWLGDDRVVRITRLRLLTERGYPYMDVSYCYGVLADGRPCRITYDGPTILRSRPKAALIEWAKQHGRYGKGMGLLDESNWSVLYG